MQAANRKENVNGNPSVEDDLAITVKVEPEDTDDLPDTQPIQNKILEGVVAYVEVRTKADNRSSAIASEVESLGARTEKTFTDSVTHVIFKEGFRRTVNKARRHNIPLVSVLWVESCKQNGCKVSEKQFPANLPDDKYLVPRVGRLRKMKSMQPREYEEDLQLSAERWHKRQQRKQELMDRKRLLEEYTPTSLGRVLVCETQPRSPTSLPCLLTPVVTPPSPESPLVRSASVIRKYRGDLPEEEIFPPLHKRLFGNQISDQSFGTPTTRCRENGEANGVAGFDTCLSRSTTTTSTKTTCASSSATRENGSSGTSSLYNTPRNQKSDMDTSRSRGNRRQSQGSARYTRRRSSPAARGRNPGGQSSVPSHSQSDFADDESQGMVGETRNGPVSARRRSSLLDREGLGAQASGSKKGEMETLPSPRLASIRVKDAGRRHSLQVQRHLVGAGRSKGESESMRGMQESLQATSPTSSPGRCGEDWEGGGRLNGRSNGKFAGRESWKPHEGMITSKSGSKTSARKCRSLLPELGSWAGNPSVLKSMVLTTQTQQLNGTRENKDQSHGNADASSIRGGSGSAGREKSADKMSARFPQSGSGYEDGRTQGSTAGQSETGSQEVPACSQRILRRLMTLQDSAPPSSFLMTPTHSSQNHVLDSLLNSPESPAVRGGGGGRQGAAEGRRWGPHGNGKKQGGGDGKKRGKEGRDRVGENEKKDWRRLGDKPRPGSQHCNVTASGDESGDEWEPARKRRAKRSPTDSPLDGESWRDRLGQRDSKTQHLISGSPERAPYPTTTRCAGRKRPCHDFVLLSDSDLSQDSSQGRALRPPLEMPHIELDDIIDRLATDDEDDRLPDSSSSKRRKVASPALRVSGARGDSSKRAGATRALEGSRARKSLGGCKEGDRKRVGARGHDGSERKQDDQNGLKETEDSLFDSDGEGGAMEESSNTQHSLPSSQQDNLGASMSAVFGDSFSASLVPHLAPNRRSIQEFSTRSRKLKSASRKNRHVNQRRTEPLSVITETNKDSPLSKSQGGRNRRGKGGRSGASEGVMSPQGEVSSDAATTPAKVQLRHAQSFTRDGECGTQDSSRPLSSQTRCLRPTLAMTSLHRQEQDVVMSVVKKLGVLEMVDRVRDTTTHVVVGDPRRTLNVLRGMARGCWILRQEWVLRSLEAGSWLREEGFEMTDRFPHAKEARRARQREEGRFRQDLFSHLGPVFVLPRTQPPSRDLTSLLRLCGAQVTKTAGQAAVTVGNTEQSGKPVVQPVWVLDSIEAGRALPVENFLLRPDMSREGSPEF